MADLNEKQTAAVDSIINMLDTGEAFQWIREKVIDGIDKPSSKWSYFNYLNMMYQGTRDARGRKQWGAVGREVKDYRRKVWILAPKMISKKDEKTGEKKMICIGFKSIGLHPYECTTGKELINNKDVQTLPEINKVIEALKVKAVYEDTGSAGGCFIPSNNRIEVKTFGKLTLLHEICHAIQKDLGMLNLEKYAENEISADVSALLLATLYGELKPNEIKNCSAYVQGWAKATGKTPQKALMAMLSDVEKIVTRYNELTD